MPNNPLWTLGVAATFVLGSWTAQAENLEAGRPGAKKKASAEKANAVQAEPLLIQSAASHPAPVAAAASRRTAVRAVSRSTKPAAPREVAPPKNLDLLLKTIQASKKSAERFAALTQIKDTYFHPVPAKVSAQLFKAAVLDKDEGVRKEAARAIKALEDKHGMKFLFGAVLQPRLEKKARKRAAKAIRIVDSPPLVEALVEIVTYNLRVGTATELTPPQIIFISNGLDVNNPLGNINLPIELPNIEIRSINTSVAVLALAGLRTIAQRNLGADPGGWQAWLKNWKHIRAVRLAQQGRR